MQAALESFLYRTCRFNPAMTLLELRTRLRGIRAYGVLFFYAFMASLTMVITFLILDYPRRRLGGPGGNEAIGDTTLLVLAMTQLALIFLIIPAYSASAIALEREKKTLGLVQATLLGPADVVSGKLLVILAFAAILLLASLPVAAWCLMLGGVSPRQLFFVYTYVFAVAVALAGLGMAVSAFQRSPMPAVVLTFGVLLFLNAGGPFLLFALMELLRWDYSAQPTVGVGGACAILLLLAAVLGWLCFLLLRSLARRSRFLRRSLVGLATPAMLAIVIAALAMAAGANLLLGPMASLEPQALLLTHPFVALYLILNPNDITSMLSTGGGGSPVTVSDPGLWLWLGSTVVTLAIGALLWLLAIAIYRWRGHDSA